MAREFEIARHSGLCCSCRKELAGGEEFMAVLFEAGEGFRRDDFCLACWQAKGAGVAGHFSLWRGRKPMPQQPKRQTVDNEVLVDFLHRLAGQEEPAKVNFRFVLALLMMRKKLLVYDGRGTDPDGREVWQMHLRSGQKSEASAAGPATQAEPIAVIRPDLDEGKIAEVTQRLGDIFEVPQ